MVYMLQHCLSRCICRCAKPNAQCCFTGFASHHPSAEHVDTGRKRDALAKCYLQRAKDEATDKTPTRKLLRLAAGTIVLVELFQQLPSLSFAKCIIWLRLQHCTTKPELHFDDASEHFVRLSRHLTQCNKCGRLCELVDQHWYS
jgi:hypothetical protein